MLYQRVLPLAHGAWLEPAAIANLAGAGTTVGHWSGKHFSDNCPGIDNRRIARVVASVGVALHGFSLEYDDGSKSAWHGAQGGEQTSFIVDKGDEITQVIVSADEHVHGVQFITAKGEDARCVAGMWM